MFRGRAKEYSVSMSVYSGTDACEFRNSLTSMIEQSLPPFEYVIVEDGPTPEGVTAVLNQFGETLGDKLRIIKLENNKGAGYASKIGLEHCQCEYVARMDSDDYSHPDRIKKQFEFLDGNPGYSLVGSWANEVTGDGRLVSVVMLPADSENFALFARRRCPCRHPCLLMKRSDVLSVGGYRNIRFAEEWDLANRLVQAGYRCANVPEALVDVKVGDDFYARRGGFAILVRILRFKINMLREKQMRLLDFFVSASSSLVVCILPNAARSYVYRKLLR